MAIADSVNDPGVEQWGDPTVVGNGSELAEGLLSLLDASRSQVQVILEQLVLDGTVITDEVSSAYSLAEEAASEALLLMERGMYEEAAVRATEALQLYGDVLMMVLDSNYGTQESITKDESTDLNELWAILERGYDYLREVNDTARQLVESGVDLAYVDGFIVEAEGYLAQAEEFLLQGDADGAEGALDSAFKFLDSSMAFMQSLNEDLTAEKAAGFLANSERRLERLEEDILNLVDPLSFDPEDYDALLQALEDTHLKNKDLKDLLEGGDLSAILGELEGFQENSDDIFGILEDGDKNVAKHLRNAYKAEVRISHHEEVVDPKGFETTTSDPEPGDDVDPKGKSSKGKSSNGKPNTDDNNGNGGKKPTGSAEGDEGSGNGSPPNNSRGDDESGNGKSNGGNSQGDDESGNGKSNGGGKKRGHSNKSQENE